MSPEPKNCSEIGSALSQRLCLGLETLEEERNLLDRASSLCRAIEIRVQRLLQSGDGGTEAHQLVPSDVTSGQAESAPKQRIIARQFARRLVLNILQRQSQANAARAS